VLRHPVNLVDPSCRLPIADVAGAAGSVESARSGPIGSVNGGAWVSGSTALSASVDLTDGPGDDHLDDGVVVDS
jgi:hypothetical protein